MGFDILLAVVSFIALSTRQITRKIEHASSLHHPRLALAGFYESLRVVQG